MLFQLLIRPIRFAVFLLLAIETRYSTVSAARVGRKVAPMNSEKRVRSG